MSVQIDCLEMRSVAVRSAINKWVPEFPRDLSMENQSKAWSEEYSERSQ